MNHVHTLDSFLSDTAQEDRVGEKFQLENERLLEINLDGQMWTKMGSSVAYRGNLKFEREKMLEQGVGRFLKKAITGEANPLTKVTGRGTLYLADEAKHIALLELNGESIHVNGNNVLAFEPTIEWDIKLIKQIAGMFAGGLFCMKLSGHGTVAICTQGRPITLRCSHSDPLSSDPNATVAWSGSLWPELKTAISFRTLIGRGSGEAIQMHFGGDGFVIVQPSEARKPAGAAAAAG